MITFLRRALDDVQTPPEGQIRPFADEEGNLCLMDANRRVVVLGPASDDTSDSNKPLMQPVIVGGTLLGTQFDQVSYSDTDKARLALGLPGGVGLVDALPIDNLYEGRLVYLDPPGKLYKYKDGNWTPEIDGADIIAASLVVAKYAASIEPVTLIEGSAVPNFKITNAIMVTGLGKIFRWKVDHYTPEVDGADIVANSVTAGQIAAGAISTEELAAGSVRAQHMLIAPKSLMVDPSFSAGATGWTGFVRRLARSDPAVPSGCPAEYATEFNGRDNVYAARLNVRPGEVYKFSCWVNRGTGGGGAGLGVLGFDYNEFGVIVNGFTPAATTATGWQLVYGYRTVPAGVASMQVGAWVDRPSYAGEAWFTDINIERVNDASLIVDGAIIAQKLAANAVVADKVAAGQINAGHLVSTTVITLSAQIGNGIITNAKIGDAQVTYAKIGDAQIGSAKIIDASVETLKIAGNAVTVPMTLRSGGVFYGNSAWQTIVAGSLYLNEPGTLFVITTAKQGYATSSGVGWNLIISVDGQDITAAGGLTARTDSVAVSGSLYVGPGSHWIEVRWKGDNSNLQFLNDTTLIMGAMR